MTGKTHFLGGLAAGGLLLSVTENSPGIALSVAAIAGIGGLLPDIDHPSSKISQKMPLVSIAYRICAVFGRVLRIEDLEHRGVLHSLLPPALLCIPVAVTEGFARTLLFALLLGYLSHILLDGFNPGGVPLLAPLVKKKLRFIPRPLCIRTGSFPEVFVWLALAVANAFLFKEPVINAVKGVFA